MIFRNAVEAFISEKTNNDFRTSHSTYTPVREEVDRTVSPPPPFFPNKIQNFSAVLQQKCFFFFGGLCVCELYNICIQLQLSFYLPFYLKPPSDAHRRRKKRYGGEQDPGTRRMVTGNEKYYLCYTTRVLK